MSSFSIRDADPGRDAAACAAIYAPQRRGGADLLRGAGPDAAAMAARIGAVSATHPWLVAEEDGEVVGFAYACPFHERPAYRWSATVSVYVAAGRTGAGHRPPRSTRRSFARLRRQGFRIACAGITLPNPASVALHERLGFVQTGVNREIGWKLGAWRDVGWWQLELAPAPPGAPPDPLPPGPAAAAG